MLEWQKLDPEYQSEKQRYEFPVPSRTFILQWLKQQQKPMLFEHMIAEFQLLEESQAEAFFFRLKAMIRDGQILQNRREGYLPIEAVDLVVGKVQAHKDGHGFLILDKGGDDWFIPPREMKALFHQDRVVARQSGKSQKGANKAAIVEILDVDEDRQIVGRFYRDGKLGYVVAEDSRVLHEIYVDDDNQLNAESGQVVVVRLIKRPTKVARAQGIIIEILGEHLDPGMEIDIAIRQYDLPHQWPVAVLDQVAEFSVLVDESDKQNRRDLRQLPLVTIDGEDARDFDDAVYCERKKSGGWRLWVAIADVSHYVPVDSPLDKEAINRGNSVYFPGNVLPMLPEILSNGLCSLNPKIDRLAFVCEMTVSESGKLTEFQFYPAVIHSHARLTYNQVWDVLDGRAHLHESISQLFPHLYELNHLYQVLNKAREKRGTINFETVETLIEFDERRKIDKIVPRERNDAHKIIEECMILANVATARYLIKNKLDGIYRVHQGPGETKLTKLREYLSDLGLWLFGGEEPQPKDYATLLNEVSQRPDFEAIQTMILRSLSQAVYTPDNEGHFGLALKEYSHFTSPIRRYPDLIVHRIIKADLAKKQQITIVGAHSYQADRLNSLGEQCSMTERRADEATRDVTEWLKCEYMLDKLGAEYTGVVTHVTNFGLFVRLNEVYVEGLVHVTSLESDFFHYDTVQQRLYGERTGVSYRLGDNLQIRVIRVDLEDRKIDFELVATKNKVKPTAEQQLKIKATLHKINQQAKDSASKKRGAKNDNKSTRNADKGSKKPKKSTKAKKRKPSKRRTKK